MDRGTIIAGLVGLLVGLLLIVFLRVPRESKRVVSDESCTCQMLPCKAMRGEPIE